MAKLELPKGVPPESYLTPIENDSLRYWVAFLIQRFWLFPIAWFLYRFVNRIEVHGWENFDKVDGQSFFIAPNHTTAFDCAVSGVFPTSSWARFWDTTTYWCLAADPIRMRFRWLQKWCIWMGVIPVDRKAGMEQFSLQDMMRVLKAGDKRVAFCLYPEGTRSKTGRMARRGKVGLGWYQKRTGFPVIPIYHKGLPQIPWCKERPQIWIGEPMTFEEYQDAEDNPLTWKGISNDVVFRLQEMERVAYGEVEPEDAATPPATAADPEKP